MTGIDKSIVTLAPAKLTGTVGAPPSKSAAHRMILGAALSALSGNGTCFVHPLELSQDITVTLGAIQAIGVSVQYENGAAKVSPGSCGSDFTPITVDCGESGSTLRFLIPIVAALGISARFIGKGRLPERPIGLYRDLLPLHGVSCFTECNSAGLPFSIKGKLLPGLYEIPGNISSQFITGLLLALPLLNGDSDIRLTTPLQSAAYVEMTLEVLKGYGITVLTTDTGWHIPGNQIYAPGEYTVEGDWSQAAFFLAAGAVNGDVKVSGLQKNSTQGDRAIFELLGKFGADIYEGFTDSGAIFGCRPPKDSKLRGIDIDASQIPDLVPILAVIGAFAEGETRILHAERLRIKESDRLAAMAQGLTRMGISVEEKPDGLIIRGGNSILPGTIDGWNDHRIVMAFSVAALAAEGQIQITDPYSIRKSFPDFFTRYNALGGNANVCSIIGLGK